MPGTANIVLPILHIYAMIGHGKKHHPIFAQGSENRPLRKKLYGRTAGRGRGSVLLQKKNVRGMEEIVKYQLVLASASPRRREILSQAGLEYIVRPSDFDERSIGAGAAPEEYVRALSRGKAAEVYRKMAGEPGASDGSAPSVLVLGADTVVAHRGRLLNKPRDRADAAEMLGRLQGDSH